MLLFVVALACLYFYFENKYSLRRKKDPCQYNRYNYLAVQYAVQNELPFQHIEVGEGPYTLAVTVRQIIYVSQTCPRCVDTLRRVNKNARFV